MPMRGHFLYSKGHCSPAALPHLGPRTSASQPLASLCCPCSQGFPLLPSPPRTTGVLDLGHLHPIPPPSPGLQRVRWNRALGWDFRFPASPFQPQVLSGSQGWALAREGGAAPGTIRSHRPPRQGQSCGRKQTFTHLGLQLTQMCHVPAPVSPTGDLR